MSQPWTFAIPGPPVNKNLLEYFTNNKALIIFHNAVSNSRVPAFLEFLVNLLSTTSHGKSAKHTSKSHGASPESSLFVVK